jgi:carboxyl-terminal processing protease
MIDGAIRGMVTGLDPHSSYFNRQDLSIFEGSTSGKFGGIGVEVEFTNGEIIVIAPIEGSPADRAGIMPGDQIVSIDDQLVVDFDPQAVVGLMRGAIGSTLRLVIRQLSTRQLKALSLTREQIAVQSVRTQLMKGGIGYFRVKAFQVGTHREFMDGLTALRREAGDLAGIILDLRNNPGGLVREAAALADEFLSDGVLFSTRHRGQTLLVDEATKGGAFTQGPLVVLINEYSASAAELVAGALKDHARAVVYGARSFGKGSVQTLLPLAHGGALKLTTALYYTPSGQTTQAHGVSPHVFVDPGYDPNQAWGALREEDLPGHLRAANSGSSAPSSTTHPAAPRRGTPPTNQQLHLGVARVIPFDPGEGPDLALRAAYLGVCGR